MSNLGKLFAWIVQISKSDNSSYQQIVLTNNTNS